MKAANAGHAFAWVVVDELVRHGVTDAVLAPGSRSTPLALALAGDGRIRLHVRIDERSAAFLAIGLIRGSGRPVPVLCTSGTATAHFHAAAMEADQSRLPLLLLTADRPPELRGVGANQTVDQTAVYGAAVRWSCDVGVPESRPDAVRYWRSLVSHAVAVLTGAAGGRPAGPVHLNVPLREPLTPTDDGVGFPHPLDGRPDGAPWSTSARGPTDPPAELTELLRTARRGVIVAGDGLTPAEADSLVQLARAAGWPVLAEPQSNARRPSVAVRASDALLSDADFVARHRPDLVLVAGRIGLSRALAGWLAATRHLVVDRDGLWLDPGRHSAGVYRCDVTALRSSGAAPPEWLASWRDAGSRAADAVDVLLDVTDRLSEPRVARDVAAALPDEAALVVASSMPIRDLDLTMSPRDGLRVFANRGVSGIDGFVSTAQGVALTWPGPVWALAGDLSLLHDANALVADPQPDLGIVVINNDGGGIFSLLPQAQGGDDAVFERVFGTPHGVDLAALASAYGVRHTLITRADELAAEVGKPTNGVHLVEVRTDRRENAMLHGELRAAAARALRG